MTKNFNNTTKNPYPPLKKLSKSHHTYFVPQHVQLHVNYPATHTNNHICYFQKQPTDPTKTSITIHPQKIILQLTYKSHQNLLNKCKNYKVIPSPLLQIQNNTKEQINLVPSKCSLHTNAHGYNMETKTIKCGWPPKKYFHTTSQTLLIIT